MCSVVCWVVFKDQHLTFLLERERIFLFEMSKERINNMFDYVSDLLRLIPVVLGVLTIISNIADLVDRFKKI